MPKILTKEQIEFYHSQGYLSPIDGISRHEAQAMLKDLDDFEDSHGMSAGRLQIKGHLCFMRSFELTFNQIILDVVEDLIGPNILAFASRFWIKKARDGAYVSWHQDSAYFGLEPHQLVTVWLTITEASEEMGCMKIIPKSHLGPSKAHEETFHDKNLLARGQAIRGVDENDAVYMPLKQGQFSCHHERLLHASDPNKTDSERVGLGLFFIPTHVKSNIGRRSACLVRGVDDFGHWDKDPTPKSRIDTDMISHIENAGRRYVDQKYRQETERK